MKTTVIIIALCCVVGVSGCIFAGPYERDINALRALEKPEKKCPGLIAYLGVGPKIGGNPSRLAQTGLAECHGKALPYLKAELGKDFYNRRARARMLETWVNILDRESIKMLLEIAQDREETPYQRATAINLLVKLNARYTRPVMESLYKDEHHPKAVRRAAKRAYKAFR